MDAFHKGLYILGVRVPRRFDSFEIAVRTILNQQITAKAADSLAGKQVKAYSITVPADIEWLTYAFSAPEISISLENYIMDCSGLLEVIGNL